MAHRIELKSYAAIPAILALAGAAFVLKPAEMRRDPLLEVQGLAGLAAKYEVMYARCRDLSGVEVKSDALSAGGLAKGFVGGYTHQFPARSDADAVSFAQKARPQCEMASLYRLDRRLGKSAHGARYARTRIDA